MSTKHPIIPPLQLIKQWDFEWNQAKIKPDEYADYITTQAARWGADQELKACCKWVDANFGQPPATNLQAFRRPKPPSLKEQALKAAYVELDPTGRHGALIIKALEALPE